MPWPLEWSVAIVLICLAAHSFWLGRATHRLQRIVTEWEDTAKIESIKLARINERLQSDARSRAPSLGLDDD